MKKTDKNTMCAAQLRGKIRLAMEAHVEDKSELSNLFGYVKKNTASRSRLSVTDDGYIRIDGIKNIRRELAIAFFYTISDVMANCKVPYLLDYDQAEYIGLLE